MVSKTNKDWEFPHIKHVYIHMVDNCKRPVYLTPIQWTEPKYFITFLGCINFKLKQARLFTHVESRKPED